MKNSIRIRENEIMLMIILAVLAVIFSVLSKSFFTINNIMQIFVQMAELSLLTLGMSICIISGGFDLSIGAMTGLGSVSLALLICAEINMWISIVLVFFMLVVCGMFNGFIVGYLNIDSMLATLGTSSLFTGIALLVSKGVAVSGLPEEFFVFGQGYVGVVPYQSIILSVVLTVSVVLLNYTKWGRNIHLIGSNAESAHFAGIDLKKNTMFVFVYSAVMSFFASLILTSRLSTGRADLGNSYALQSVSAAIFGGVDIGTGEGNLIGAILGVAIFAVISNGLNMLDFSQYIQQIVIGFTLIAVLSYKKWKSNINK